MYGHGGVLVAADASTKDGWGAHVGGMGAGLMWEDATKEAIEGSRSRRQTGERVSISPLEMVSQAFLLVMVGVLWGKRVGQVVMRCDNKACCDVVSSGRPRSPATVKAFGSDLSTSARKRTSLRMLSRTTTQGGSRQRRKCWG